MKVEELTGTPLDCWVARAIGWSGPIKYRENQDTLVWHKDGVSLTSFFQNVKSWKPSSNWSQGGPIIEREHISVVPSGAKWDAYANAGYTGPDGQVDSKTPIIWEAPTYLVAAMRAYVASKFGDEVPDEA